MRCARCVVCCLSGAAPGLREEPQPAGASASGGSPTAPDVDVLLGADVLGAASRGRGYAAAPTTPRAATNAPGDVTPDVLDVPETASPSAASAGAPGGRGVTFFGIRCATH